MLITINGERKEFDAAIALSRLIEELGLEPRKIAIERNLEIVPKAAYASTQIADGDRIEIVQFVGGG